MDVLAAGAGLSLLTKLDDQVIDGLPFHGRQKDAHALRRRLCGYLWPTLWSILEASPASSGDPRTEMAAELGRGKGDMLLFRLGSMKSESEMPQK